MKEYRVSRSIVSLTRGLDTRLRWVAILTPPDALRPGKNPLSIDEGARWAQSRSGCVRRESRPAGNGTPAQSVVTSRLRHPGRCYGDCMTNFVCPLLSSCLVCLSLFTFPLVFLLLLSRGISFSRFSLCPFFSSSFAVSFFCPCSLFSPVCLCFAFFAFLSCSLLCRLMMCWRDHCCEYCACVEELLSFSLITLLISFVFLLHVCSMWTGSAAHVHFRDV